MGILSGGGGGGRPGRVASVEGLPMYSIPSASLRLKDGQATEANAGAAAFFTAGGQANMGAAGQLVAAGAWVTVVDLAGRGVLSALVLSQAAAGSTESVRVTIDGVARVLDVTDIAGERAVVGALVPSYPVMVSGDGVGPVLGYGARGFDLTGDGGLLTLWAGTLPTAAEALAMGFPVVEYFSSLKVEFKTSRAPVPADVDRVLAVYGALPAWA